jgi:putative component of membrane protein insertase Oxa1/YidC/SpoIIIJ protein YidD
VARLLIYLVLLSTAVSSQSVPADSLLSGAELSFGQKLSIKPIALFQRFSYATPGLHCQFEPSCSHFMALSIARHNVIKGLVIGTDRLIRCNPFAFQYHQKEHPGQFSVDGRLLDPVPGGENRTRPNIHTICSIIPGLGRALAGRPGDGILSFITVVTLGAVTYQAHQRGSMGGTAVFGSLTAVFWLADFYAASRATRINNSMSEYR